MNSFWSMVWPSVGGSIGGILISEKTSLSLLWIAEERVLEI